MSSAPDAAGADEPERSWARYRVPWPLVWLDRDRREARHHKAGFVIAPLLWHYTESKVQEDGSERRGHRTTLWPLVTWARGTEGDAHVWVVSHGWEDPSQAYKRIYRGIFEVFQFHREADGEKETRLLWRLYHHRRGPRGRYLSLASLFTYDSRGDAVGEEDAYASALFGLVKCSWSKGGRRWRVLYIPFGGTGDTSAESRDAEAR
ncbi:MAG: hypothetical protein AMK73_02775 [Planctomycetes bacterium SM23_32]|nr:MAG: hypothetical protein AMK73_02775 [Planctomycetes bacterium SM23_32]